MKNIRWIGLGVAALVLAMVWWTLPTTDIQQDLHQKAAQAEAGDSPIGRAEYDRQRLADPATGTIPRGIRSRELAYAATLPVSKERKRGTANEKLLDWVNVGPSNVGGRTRALAIDVTDENNWIAGGISGGMWRSTDGGQTWQRATLPGQHPSISCVTQDKRPGKTNVWYAGSGESIGNSASESFSAFYLGNGLLRSTDNGASWEEIESTVSGTPTFTDAWDLVWNLVADPSEANDDVLYAALIGNIMRSTDGGDTWEFAIENTGFLNSAFTDVHVAEDGTKYATLSSGSDVGGIYRSDNGTDWVDIRPGAWPSNFDRTVIASDPSNPDVVYFLAETPGSGAPVDPDFPGGDGHNLWKYEYQSGDGSGTGGIWTDLTSNIPVDSTFRGTFNSQGSYNLCMAVSPHDPNAILIGGTNLYVSTDGFTTSDNVNQIGGYKPDSPPGPWGYRWDLHHPDQHVILFSPSDPDALINGNDGGVYRTEDFYATDVEWTPLSKGYVISQFYTVAIDHGTVGSEVVVGGLQDNGTQWTNTGDPNFDWTSPNLGDGSFCAIEDGAGHYYFSRQFARIIKGTLTPDGTLDAYTRIDPDNANGFSFINPFILDPADNNIMYLSSSDEIWRNTDLAAMPLNNEYEQATTGWGPIPGVPTGQSFTALAGAQAPNRFLFAGTSGRRIYKITDPQSTTPITEDITGNIPSGGYTSCIAVNPRNPDRLMVVYSNYNIGSVYYTEDGGENWEAVGGNLEPAPENPNAPWWLNDGPSCRYAAIIPVGNETVFLLGTSVGLFGTKTLDGENTVWVKQAEDVIGNAIVEMIDYREEDGFVAVGTHGNGVFTTFIEDANQVTSNEDLPAITETEVNVYPNPATDQVNFSLGQGNNTPATVRLFGPSGQLLRQQQMAVGGPISLDVSDLPAGIYLYTLEQNDEQISGRLLVQ